MQRRLLPPDACGQEGIEHHEQNARRLRRFREELVRNVIERPTTGRTHGPPITHGRLVAVSTSQSLINNRRQSNVSHGPPPQSAARFASLRMEEDPDGPLVDYRMTRVTFGVSASSFAANMAMKQNALEHMDTHPMLVERYSTRFMLTMG